MRMSGPRPTAAQVAALGTWLNALPEPNPVPPADLAAVARGRVLFDTAECSGCHAGPHLTNNVNYDVGTGGAFQVPSLRAVRWHPPYLHDGCARDLHARFGFCGGRDAHGTTSTLSSDEIDDLVAYLETL
jgi:cytochrome c peroxidase